jgi:mRNA interferase YafQ
MRIAEYSTQFQRDVRLAQRRGRNLEKLKRLLALLIAADAPLPAIYKDHPLKGEWVGCRDVHMEPDWLLLYRLSGNVVRFERTGTHSDLFD